ncbi:MAG: hypothetical protein KDA74_14965, partial [Planctomycetaceae bacterium]|nr:hypothetical protein [Planctomycetaceae bacterium]
MPAAGAQSYSSSQDGMTPDIMPVPEPETTPEYAPPAPATSGQPEARLQLEEGYQSRNPFAPSEIEQAVKVALESGPPEPQPRNRLISAEQGELPITDPEKNIDVELLPATSFVE